MNTPEVDKEYMDMDILIQFGYADLQDLFGKIKEAEISVLEAIVSATELQLESTESMLRGKLHFIQTNLLLIDMALAHKEELTTQDFGNEMAGVLFLN